MPLPALLGPASVAAAKAVAYEYLPVISSASFAAVLIRLALNRIPDWIKEDVSFRNTRSEIKGGPAGEMQRLSSVLEKLQALAASASQKLHSPVPYLYASLLAYVQLSAQLKKISPQSRNERYHTAGRELTTSGSVEHDEIMKEQLEVLQQALDYAIWAYYVDDEAFLRKNLEPVGLELIQSAVATRPGSVGHFMATSKQKILLIGIKGTSSLEDLLTDTCGRSVSYQQDDEQVISRVEVCAQRDDKVLVAQEDFEIVSGHERIWVENHDNDQEDDQLRCHEGIYIASQRLATHVRSTVERLVVQGDYTLQLTGHSLGASAASLLALLLLSDFPQLSRDKISVYAFAPPPVLDHDSAIAASPFITSVVNNADLVARSSLVNLAVFLEFLRTVSDRLQEAGLAPTSPQTTAAFLHKLSQGDNGDTLMTQEEVVRAMEAAHDKVELRHPEHLYVPGRVLLLYEDWDDGNSKESSTVVARRYCTVTDGTAAVLRFFEVDGYRMLGDHTTTAYSASIEALLTQCRKQTSMEPSDA